MATSRAEFKRILLELHRNASGQSMRLAAEVASLLRLDLLGLFVQDESLLNLAALPFAREFRPLSGWRPIEAEQLTQEWDLAARTARRLLAQAADALGTTWQFEVVRGPADAAIGSVSRAGDIVIVAEPASPADRAAHSFAASVEAAFQSASAVMLVPETIARRSGAVVALAMAPDDPSIHVAAAIASSARETLVVFDACATSNGAPGGASGEKSIVLRPKQLSHPSGIAATFHPMQERLIVMTRGAFADSVAFMIASLRHDPVLIIRNEP